MDGIQVVGIGTLPGSVKRISRSLYFFLWASGLAGNVQLTFAAAEAGFKELQALTLIIGANSVILLQWTNGVDDAPFPAGTAEGAVFIGVRIGSGRYRQWQICDNTAETTADTLFRNQVLGQTECSQSRCERGMAFRPVTDVRRLASFLPGRIPDYRKSRVQRWNCDSGSRLLQQIRQICSGTV